MADGTVGGAETSSARGARSVSSAFLPGSARNKAMPARTKSGVIPSGASTAMLRAPSCTAPVFQSTHEPSGSHTSRRVAPLCRMGAASTPSPSRNWPAPCPLGTSKCMNSGRMIGSPVAVRLEGQPVQQRQQAITTAQHAAAEFERSTAETPRLLARCIERAVDAEERHQCAEFHPPDEQFRRGAQRLDRAVLAWPATESAHVGTGHRQPGQAEVDRHVEVLAQVLPGRVVVAGPHRGVPLDSEEARARQHERTLAGTHRLQARYGRLGHAVRIQVPHASMRTP